MIWDQVSGMVGEIGKGGILRRVADMLDQVKGPLASYRPNLIRQASQTLAQRGGAGFGGMFGAGLPRPAVLPAVRPAMSEDLYMDEERLKRKGI